MYLQPAKYIEIFFAAVQEYFIAYSRCRETAVALQPDGRLREYAELPILLTFYVLF